MNHIGLVSQEDEWDRRTNAVDPADTGATHFSDQILTATDVVKAGSVQD